MTDNERLAILKLNNTFKNYKEIDRLLDFKKYRSNLIKLQLDHYCKYHMENNKVVIDCVFENVLPFLRYDKKIFKYNIGQVITVSTGSYIIEDRFFDKNPYAKANCKWYECKCTVDNNVFNLTEKRINQGIGCPICGNRKLIPGFRSLYDSHPEILPYIKNKEVAKTYTPCSSRYITCKCPECNYEKDIIVSNLVKNGFSCPFCSDHISYPNKYIRQFLTQLGVIFEPEKKFSWSDGKIYDQYIDDFSMIIENHGIQHYEDTSFSSLSTQMENDQYKKMLAMKNGIKYYIIIDCRKSISDYIMNSIMSSELPLLLNFSKNDIDWSMCDQVARSSLIPEIWEEWNKTHDINYLSNKYHINHHTIRDYVNFGFNVSKCDINPMDNYLNVVNEIQKDVHAKPIFCETDNIYFKSKEECDEYYKDLFPKSGARNLYNYINTQRPYKGKIFKYISKANYNDIKRKSINDKNIIVIGDYYLDKYAQEG